MPQPTKGPRLGGSPAHQKLMLANLATSLFTHGKIHTTRAKAERLRPYAERLITKAKRGDLHNRRLIAQVIRDKDVLHRLMAEIGPFFADRPGGYTRIVKTLPRRGDNAPMAIIELVNERTASAEAGQATRVAAQPAATTGAADTGAATTGDAATTGAAAADTTPATTEELGGGSGATTTPADTTPADTTPADTTPADTTSSTTVEEGGASGATTGAVEAGTAESDGPEVPEPMAENAADSAGLSTDSGSSSDEPEDRS